MHVEAGHAAPIQFLEIRWKLPGGLAALCECPTGGQQSPMVGNLVNFSCSQVTVSRSRKQSLHAERWLPRANGAVAEPGSLYGRRSSPQFLVHT